jgi:hypothetical protein
MITTSYRVRLRATALALATTGTLAALLGALAPTTDLSPDQPFADLLGQWCTIVLLGCATWAWLVTLVVLLEAVRAAGGAAGPAPVADRRRGLPTAYRRVLLSACGLALTAGAATPALATPGPIHLVPPAHVVQAALARAVPVVPSTTSVAHPSSAIVVRPGDSLWRLAAERLPADAGDETITQTWHRLYAANRDVIGPDPDRLEPGQRLSRPRVW